MHGALGFVSRVIFQFNRFSFYVIIFGSRTARQIILMHNASQDPNPTGQCLSTFTSRHLPASAWDFMLVRMSAYFEIFLGADISIVACDWLTQFTVHRSAKMWQAILLKCQSCQYRHWSQAVSRQFDFFYIHMFHDFTWRTSAPSATQPLTAW